VNLAQTVDPYKVWNRFPGPVTTLQASRYSKTRNEVVSIIKACPGSYARELRAKTGRAKRAMFALLQTLQHEGLINRVGQRYYPK